MKKTRLKVTADDIQSITASRTDWRKFDATTEEDIVVHEAEDTMPRQSKMLHGMRNESESGLP